MRGPDSWPASMLSSAHRDFLSSFEPTVNTDIDGLGLVLCCHAGPDSDEFPIITPATPDEVIAEALASTEANLVIAGHTHMQFDRSVAGHRMVNAGSVGRPYADQPGAYWALLGPEVDLRRTAYDFAAAADAMRRTKCPDSEELAAGIVQPPSAEEAMALFERMAGRTLLEPESPRVSADISSMAFKWRMSILRSDALRADRTRS